MRLLILLFFSWAGCFAQTNTRPNIAVTDFTGDASVTAEQLQFISAKMAGELLATQAYTVLERNRMAGILAEQGFQQSGACNSSECQIQVGQLLGVDQLVAGSLVRFGPTYMMRLDLLDVGSGKILNSIDVQKKGELHEIVNDICREGAQRLAAGPHAEGIATTNPQAISNTAPAPRTSSKSWKLPTVLGLGVAGAGMLVLGKLADNAMMDARSSYDALPSATTQKDIDAAWSKVENKQDKRNLYYGIGAALLAVGITVQLAF